MPSQLFCMLQGKKIVDQYKHVGGELNLNCVGDYQMVICWKTLEIKYFQSFLPLMGGMQHGDFHLDRENTEKNTVDSITRHCIGITNV